MNMTVKDDQVFKSIVGPVSVDVMHMLISEQLPPECLFHDEPVLKHVTIRPVWRSDSDVTVQGAAPASPRRMSRTTFRNIMPTASVGSPLTAVVFDGRPTATLTQGGWIAERLPSSGMMCDEPDWALSNWKFLTTTTFTYHD